MHLRNLDSKLLALTKPFTTALFLLGVASLAACSEASTYAPTDSGRADTNAQDSGTDGDDTSPDEPSPTWLSLTAPVAVEAGALVPENTELDWSILDALEEILCSTVVPVTAGAPEDPLPDLALTVAWNLDTRRGSGDCGAIASAIPSDFGLAFGELDTNLVAVLGNNGYDGLEENLWGVYLSTDDWATMVVFGAAATAEGWKGKVEADPESALPDGLYRVVTLYLLPY